MRMLKMTVKRSHRKHPPQRKSPKRKLRVKPKTMMKRSVARDAVGVAAGGEAAAKRRERKVRPIRKSPQTRKPSLISLPRRKERDPLVNVSLKLNAPEARLRIT